MPKLTIGLPVYNSSGTLSTAIQSVLEQTFTDWELIICDDASTDGTFDVAKAIRDPRIRVVRNDSNLGLSGSLNRITGLAKSPVLARMDSDDLIHPNRLAFQFRMLEETASLEVISTEAFVIDDDDRVLGGRRKGQIKKTTPGVLWHNGPIHASIMARKSWFARFPYVSDLHRGEDLELWARAMPSTTHRHLAERLYFIRENPHVSVSKYCRTISAHSKVFRMCAHRGDVSYANATALVLRSYLRMGVYRAAGVLGQQSRIAARRVEELSTAELNDAQAVVDQIIRAAKCREEASDAVR